MPTVAILGVFVVLARDGAWLTVHASRLSGAPREQRITIVLEQADASSTVSMRLCAYGLSQREAEVACRPIDERPPLDLQHFGNDPMAESMDLFVEEAVRGLELPCRRR